MNRQMSTQLPACHADLELAEDALAGDAEAAGIVLSMLQAPQLTAALRGRGASSAEASELIADLCGDCFGGERTKGGLHRLLGRYNGKCPLPAYFRHIAINRLISLKRKQRPTVSTDMEDAVDLPSPVVDGTPDAALIALLREALKNALARIDPEKLVAIRLIESYGVQQKEIGALFGWHESKISRAKKDFTEELKTNVMEEIHRADPWLQLEWEDFLALCAESLDLFAV